MNLFAIGIFFTLATFNVNFNVSENEANNLGQEVITNLNNLCEEKNKILCLPKIKLNRVVKSTKKIVNGFLYDVGFDTNMGFLDMQVWKQEWPNMTSIHKYVLNNKDLIASPVKYLNI